MAGEKRSAEDLNQHRESTIIIDVEGTTSSIGFVKDTLFPHVREHLKKHIAEKWDDEEFKADMAKLKAQAKEDEEQKLEGFVAIKDGGDDEAKESVIKNVLWQMDNDRKTGALKQLQGHIWKAKHAPLKGHVYDDVPKAFEEWTKSDKKLYIYSSGSIEAQKLLFGDSVHGDLLKYLSGHFDTEVGPKQEIDSYKNILKQINAEPENTLFLTDVIKEAEAAKAAGLSTIIVVREGNAKLSDEEKDAFKTIESFTELSFQSATKRQKLEVVVAEKKDVTTEEKPATVVEQPTAEPMDTSEEVDATEKKVQPNTDDKVTDSKVEEAEKTKESAKPADKEETIEKEVTPIEEDASTEGKTVSKTETEKTETEPVNKVKESEEKMETVVEDKSKIEVSTESEKKTEETETMLEESEPEKKTEKTTKEADKVVEESEVETEKTEGVAKNETEEVVEKATEKVTEKIDEEVAEKVTEEAAPVQKAQEVKSDEKEIPEVEKKLTEDVKENGEPKAAETEKVTKPTEDKVDEGENKENVVAKVEKSTEPEAEVVEEAKEVEKEKESEDKVKAETEIQKDESKKLNGTTTNGDSTKDVAEEKVHSNGVSDEDEKTKENGDTEESLKVKKAVADGAGEPDVVTPPVVAATS